MQNLHPLFTHFPIALLGIVPFIDFLGILRDNPAYHKAAGLTLFAGMIGTVGAVISGLRAESTLPLPPDVIGIVVTHRFWGLTLLAFAISTLLLRPKPSIKRRRRVTMLIGETVLLWSTIVFTGHYGGRLVYEFGVGTEQVSTDIRSISNFANDSTHTSNHPHMETGR
jgi:uncharacterized membrane protein